MNRLKVQSKLAHWLTQLQANRAIAVIRSPDPQLGLNMAKAVAAGGIRLIEITWNSDQPMKLVRQLRTELPNCTLGAGTIINFCQLEEAIHCECEFIFSPHVNPALIQAAVHAGIPIIPGALTPTEIVTAWEAGASCVKVFPIQAVGGVNYIKAIKAPLGDIPLIPTGGVTLENAKDFIQAGAIAVGLSSELFPKGFVEANNWEAITQQVTQFHQQLIS